MKNTGVRSRATCWCAAFHSFRPVHARMRIEHAPVALTFLFKWYHIIISTWQELTVSQRC